MHDRNKATNATILKLQLKEYGVEDQLKNNAGRVPYMYDESRSQSPDLCVVCCELQVGQMRARQPTIGKQTNLLEPRLQVSGP